MGSISKWLKIDKSSRLIKIKTIKNKMHNKFQFTKGKFIKINCKNLLKMKTYHQIKINQW